jgi:hypothetical protein
VDLILLAIALDDARMSSTQGTNVDATRIGFHMQCSTHSVQIGEVEIDVPSPFIAGK